jgi:hypothetical protein
MLLVVHFSEAAGRGGPVKKAPILAIPKPINLPSRRAENHGFDPSINLVSGGTWSANKSGQGAPAQNSQAQEQTGPSRAPWADTNAQASRDASAPVSSAANFPRLGEQPPSASE